MLVTHAGYPAKAGSVDLASKVQSPRAHSDSCCFSSFAIRTIIAQFGGRPVARMPDFLHANSPHSTCGTSFSSMRVLPESAPPITTTTSTTRKSTTATANTTVQNWARPDMSILL